MEQQFNKKFNFIKNPNWKIPHHDEFYSTSTKKYEPLQVIKSILNFVKHKLDDYKIEGIANFSAYKAIYTDWKLFLEWSEHTRKRFPAQQVVFHLKNEIKAEFVTQAFAKMYECLNSYSLIPNDKDIDDKFFSVHLCEAPVSWIF